MPTLHRIPLVAGLSIILGAPLAHAQAADRWLVLGTGEPTIALDTTTITKSTFGGFPRVWVRLLYKTPQAVGAKRYVRELWRMDIDCAKRQTSMVSILDYAADGEMVSNHPEVMGLKWDEVAPDTIGEATFNAFCKSRFGKL